MDKQFVSLALVLTLFANSAFAGVPVDTTIILDNFTDTDSTALASHTISPTNTVSAPWTVPTGTVAIASNRVETSGAPYGWAVLDSTHADGTITMTVRLSIAGEAYLLFRYDDASNWCALYWTSSTGALKLSKIVAGVETVIDSTTKTFNTSTNYVMQVVMTGSTLSATVDGGSALSGSSSGFNDDKTKHGFLGLTGLSVDDWTMTIPAGAPASFIPGIINAPVRGGGFPFVTWTHFLRDRELDWTFINILDGVIAQRDYMVDGKWWTYQKYPPGVTSHEFGRRY